MISSSRALFDRLWINVETGRRPATSARRPRVSEPRTSDAAAGNTSFITAEAPQQPAAKRSDARQRRGWWWVRGGVGVGGLGHEEEKNNRILYSRTSLTTAPTDHGPGGRAFADSPWFSQKIIITIKKTTFWKLLSAHLSQMFEADQPWTQHRMRISGNISDFGNIKALKKQQQPPDSPPSSGDNNLHEKRQMKWPFISFYNSCDLKRDPFNPSDS